MPAAVPQVPAAPPVLQEDCRMALERLKGIRHRGPVRGGGDDEYDAKVNAELEILRARVSEHFDALLACYRDLPRPGDKGDAIRRTALLYLLPGAKRRELDDEVCRRFLAVLRDPKDPDHPDLPFLAYAVRHHADAQSLMPLIEALSSLPDAPARMAACEALAWKPSPECLPALLSAWKAGKGAGDLAAPLAYACAKCPSAAAVPALREMLPVSGSLAVRALGMMSSSQAMDLLLETAGKGADTKVRVEALSVLGFKCLDRVTQGRGRGWSGPDSPLGFDVACRLADEQADIRHVEGTCSSLEDEAERVRILGRMEALAQPGEPEDVLVALCQALGSTRRVSVAGTLAILQQDPRPKVREAAAKARQAILKDPR